MLLSNLIKSIISPMLLKDTTKIEFRNNSHMGMVFSHVIYDDYTTDSIKRTFHVVIGGEIPMISISNMIFGSDTITTKKWYITIPRYNHRDFMNMLNNDVDLKSHKIYNFMSKIFESYTKLDPNETVVHTISTSKTETFYGSCDRWGSKYKHGYTQLLNHL